MLEIKDRRSGHARQPQLVRQVVFVLLELLIDIGGKRGMDFVDLNGKSIIDYSALKLPYLLLHARRIGVVAREHRENLEIDSNTVSWLQYPTATVYLSRGCLSARAQLANQVISNGRVGLKSISLAPNRYATVLP